MKVDENGQPVRDRPRRRLVFAPDGTQLGLIDTGQPTANCGWGDDGSVLYITSNHELYRLKTTTRGKMP